MKHTEILTTLFLSSLLYACGGGGGGSAGPAAANTQNANPPPVSTVNAVTLSWAPPTQREDLSTLNTNELSGFKIYYGTSSGVYAQSVTINNPNQTSYEINNLGNGRYYFVITALDSDGNESTYSNEAIKDFSS